MNLELIQKEQLGFCRFSPGEVLSGDWEKVYRLYSLQRAERLGKKHSSRVRLSFRTLAGETRMVKALVTGFDDQFVHLSGGYTIPLRAVFGIEF